MVVAVTDPTRESTGDTAGPHPRPPAERPEAEGAAQLTLDATIVGPGMRTEDPFEPGTVLRIKGQRGTFVYKHATVSRNGQVSLHIARNGVSRAVRLDQVTLVAKVRPRR
jgi:hypothetical protein